MLTLLELKKIHLRIVKQLNFIQQLKLLKLLVLYVHSLMSYEALHATINTHTN